MKTIAMGLSAAALVLAGGGAYAAQVQAQNARWGDTDGNGVLTRAEAQAQAATRFAKLDQNKDGKLDQADRQLAHEARKTQMFERLDTNKDGQITKAEFMADRGPGDRGHRMAMRGGDGDKGPGMGPKGHRGGSRGGHWGGRGGGMMMGKMADANSDGAVTQVEFSTAALKRFDMIDANKDGQVTKEERQAAREQMKAKWQQMREQKAQG
ncbi:EF-hand domain-containing protein [Novosphingobium sp. 9U]|uniref:EF-hand domain-containing protein n=1 Tax=Novosphingobium sp. 9U TaxID=2653158 RepID=UPI0012F3ADBE|nr:EF-hand domain-containing protein [Novosphingobium sp. 9U]VWX53351.1 conserved exported hypothetical protein [Novosphingobium sp. 9U]